MKKENVREIDLGYIPIANWESTDGLTPSWAREKGEPELDHNEKVLQGSKDYKLEIDYPLSRPCILDSRTPSVGVSRINFVEAVVQAYRDIYDAEDETSKVKAGNIPGMFNRNTTDGKYGIWGHDIGDLMLHTAYVDEETGIITLGVDS